MTRGCAGGLSKNNFWTWKFKWIQKKLKFSIWKIKFSYHANFAHSITFNILQKKLTAIFFFFAPSQVFFFHVYPFKNAKISIKADMRLFALSFEENLTLVLLHRVVNKRSGKFPERKTLFMSNCFHSPQGKNKQNFGLFMSFFWGRRKIYEAETADFHLPHKRLNKVPKNIP